MCFSILFALLSDTVAIQFRYIDFGYIQPRKMKWANVTKLQNNENFRKITPFFAFFERYRALF